MHSENKDLIDQFQRDGYILFENALTSDQLSSLNAELANWVDESKKYTQPFGKIKDGRPRFDLEPKTHSPENPAVRRITSPAEISEVCLDVVKDNKALDLVAEIFGPNINHLGNKINLKQPGAGTEVKFHQDFPFEPHSNEDIMTVLYFLDDVTLDNGPLEVVPGTHIGPLHSHWQDGVFTGAVDDKVAESNRGKAVSCLGKAGSACLMHSKLLHGSTPNRSSLPRSLFIVTYTAEDAVALSPNHLPSDLVGMIVRGKETGTVRCSSYSVELPEYPKEASFFGQQSKSKNIAM
jgi:phytanoyl-CoA hydroxylase